jgi:hypothetical protein
MVRGQFQLNCPASNEKEVVEAASFVQGVQWRFPRAAGARTGPTPHPGPAPLAQRLHPGQAAVFNAGECHGPQLLHRVVVAPDTSVDSLTAMFRAHYGETPMRLLLRTA